MISREKHDNLLRLVKLGLHEQAKIISKEVYDVFYIRITEHLKVVHTISATGLERPYIIFWNGKY